MRGTSDQQIESLVVLTPEDLVPQEHPIRRIMMNGSMRCLGSSRITITGVHTAASAGLPPASRLSTTSLGTTTSGRPLPPGDLRRPAHSGSRTVASSTRLRPSSTSSSRLPTTPPTLAGPNHGDLKPIAVRLPQPDAVHRLDGTGGRPWRGPCDRPPSPDRPARRRHRREGEPRDRPSAFEPPVLPDSLGHCRGRRRPGLRHALGLRARLPGVQRVAGAADPPDGRGRRRLPSCRDTLSPASTRSGLAWSSTAGAASTPRSPSTTAAGSVSSARAWPCAGAPSTTGCGP